MRDLCVSSGTHRRPWVEWWGNEERADTHVGQPGSSGLCWLFWSNASLAAACVSAAQLEHSGEWLASLGRGSLQGSSLRLQSSRKKLQLLRLLFIYFYVYEHLACIYVCIPPTCLLALALDQKKEKGFAISLSLTGETLGSFIWRCPCQTVHIHSLLCPLRPHSLLVSLAPHTKPSWIFY